MKKINIYLILIGILLAGCVKRKTTTVKICDSLYAEMFTNSTGITEGYLTDSSNFRLFVDRWDEEHEIIRYTCLSDSIIIVKTENGSKNCRTVTLTSGLTTVLCETDTISRKTYSISQLKEKHKFE